MAGFRVGFRLLTHFVDRSKPSHLHCITAFPLLLVGIAGGKGGLGRELFDIAFANYELAFWKNIGKGRTNFNASILGDPSTALHGYGYQWH